MANVNLQDSRAENRVGTDVFFMILCLFSSSAVSGSDEAREMGATRTLATCMSHLKYSSRWHI